MGKADVVRADLHIHTKYSQDSSINPKTLVNQLFAHESIKAVAVTDHNNMDGYDKVWEMAKPFKDILIVPGVEITTPVGDLLVLGVTGLPPKPWNVECIIDFAKKNGGVVIAAHPYREYGLGSLAKNYEVDAIEVLNGGTPSHLNKLAENLAREMNAPGVAGTDAHNVDELWTVYTEVQASLEVDEVLRSIKKGLVKACSCSRSIPF
jgi:predicted metal-dependent phosphoesterase TrpH